MQFYTTANPNTYKQKLIGTIFPHRKCEEVLNLNGIEGLFTQYQNICKNLLYSPLIENLYHLFST